MHLPQPGAEINPLAFVAAIDLASIRAKEVMAMAQAPDIFWTGATAHRSDVFQKRRRASPPAALALKTPFRLLIATIACRPRGDRRLERRWSSLEGVFTVHCAHLWDVGLFPLASHSDAMLFRMSIIQALAFSLPEPKGPEPKGPGAGPWQHEPPEKYGKSDCGRPPPGLRGVVT
jgi:hypothetical protein